MTTLETLPTEMVNRIVALIPKPDLLNFRLTSGLLRTKSAYNFACEFFGSVEIDLTTDGYDRLREVCERGYGEYVRELNLFTKPAGGNAREFPRLFVQSAHSQYPAFFQSRVSKAFKPLAGLKHLCLIPPVFRGYFDSAMKRDLVDAWSVLVRAILLAVQEHQIHLIGLTIQPYRDWIKTTASFSVIQPLSVDPGILDQMTHLQMGISHYPCE